MENEGPVRQVLRASVDFDKSLENGWKLTAAQHDLATALAFLTAVSALAAFWVPLTLLLSMPALALGAWSYRRVSVRRKVVTQETEELFDRYRTVLEESLIREDWKRHANGKSHPLGEDGEPAVQG